jgi:hypothetical protein
MPIKFHNDNSMLLEYLPQKRIFTYLKNNAYNTIPISMPYLFPYIKFLKLNQTNKKLIPQYLNNDIDKVLNLCDSNQEHYLFLNVYMLYDNKPLPNDPNLLKEYHYARFPNLFCRTICLGDRFITNSLENLAQQTIDKFYNLAFTEIPKQEVIFSPPKISYYVYLPKNFQGYSSRI